VSGPQTSYLICATARSGSSLLCEALNDAQLAGRPWEYFYDVHEAMWRERWQIPPEAPFEDYLARVMDYAATPNGVWAAKVMMGYFKGLLGRLRATARLSGRDLPDSELLARAFPNLRYVWITRRDKVRQAVSLARAIQTQAWWAEMEPVRDPSYDFAAIDRLLQLVVLHEAGWQSFFAAHAITPFVVVYEDFVHRYGATALDILDFLAVPHPGDLAVPEPKLMRKQADALSEQWVERFLQEKAAGQEVSTGYP
jgi:LPS sulfotransferase NodH